MAYMPTNLKCGILNIFTELAFNSLNTHFKIHFKSPALKVESNLKSSKINFNLSFELYIKYFLKMAILSNQSGGIRQTLIIHALFAKIIN